MERPAVRTRPIPAKTAGGDKTEVALKCEGKMAGHGELKCLFWIDDVKVTQKHTKGTVKKVTPGDHKFTAQAFYRDDTTVEEKWIKAPTGKKNKTVDCKAGKTTEVPFDFGLVKPPKK